MSEATYPIVLAQGITRFDVLARKLFEEIEARGRDLELPDRLHYFRGIKSSLEAEGFRVEHSDVPKTQGVAVRAQKLKEQVERILAEAGAEKVHLVAHCTGGLDARHMLFEGRDELLHERVASLTTIGTPHLGTSFADWGVANATQLRGLLALAQDDPLEGFADLTTEACAAFNELAEPFERECGVLFQTYAGTQALSYVFSPLQLAWILIWRVEGDNDGLVSLRSATWKSEYFKGCIDADHLNQVGWWDDNEPTRQLFPPVAFDRRQTQKEMETRIRGLYLQIARDLRERFPAG